MCGHTRLKHKINQPPNSAPSPYIHILASNWSQFEFTAEACQPVQQFADLCRSFLLITMDLGTTMRCSRQPKKVNLFSRLTGQGRAGLVCLRRNEISSEASRQCQPGVSIISCQVSRTTQPLACSRLCEILSWGWRENCLAMLEDEES